MEQGTSTSRSTTEAAWHELHGRLLSFLRARVRNDADAEDLLQDVFTRIHENAHRLAEVESVTAWIFRVTRNAVIDFHRARARRPEVLVDSAEDVGAAIPANDETDAASARAELTACLVPLLARLPERYREPITLTELDGLPHKEAADRMGLSLPAIKSRVSRGRSKLKDVLLDCCHIELDRRRGIANVAPRENAGCACDCRRPTQPQ